MDTTINLTLPVVRIFNSIAHYIPNDTWGVLDDYTVEREIEAEHHTPIYTVEIDGKTEPGTYLKITGPFIFIHTGDPDSLNDFFDAIKEDLEKVEFHKAVVHNNLTWYYIKLV